MAFSPPLDFIPHVLFPHLSAMNVHARVVSFTKGFYPVGKGRLQIEVEPQLAPVLPISLISLGHVSHVKAVVWGTGLGADHSDLKNLLIQELTLQLRHELGVFISPDVPITIWEDPSSVVCGESTAVASVGTAEGARFGNSFQKKSKYRMLGCQLWCETSSGSTPCACSSVEMGGSNKTKMATGIDPTMLASQVVRRLRVQLASGASMDEHTADHLLIFMAAAAASVESAVTSDGISSILCEPFHAEHSSRHIETAIYVIEKLFDARCSSGDSSVSCKFTLSEVDNGCRLIECRPWSLRGER